MSGQIQTRKQFIEKLIVPITRYQRQKPFKFQCNKALSPLVYRTKVSHSVSHNIGSHSFATIYFF